ncbi:MAG: hypothetical protein L0207_03840 [Chlamydiae bacterium]|nr:hypothetical protein [Chlamydiota bacterium]
MLFKNCNLLKEKGLKSFLFLCLFIFAGCFKSAGQNGDHLTSLQIIDRNGFSETISNQDRLSLYKKVDFLSAQPYQKVLRVFGKNKEGKSLSKLTSYHSNGQIWQYLEAVDGRAHGRYLEWYENGERKAECDVIEGTADLNEMSQTSWLFDGIAKVWNEKGVLSAEMQYEKGFLHGQSHYYNPSGLLWKEVKFDSGFICDDLIIYDEAGSIKEKIPHKNGMRFGKAVGYWKKDLVQYEEDYVDGLLQSANYFGENGEKISAIVEGKGVKTEFVERNISSSIEYCTGKPEGEVKLFSKDGSLTSSYHIKNGKKHGEEVEYYPDKILKPKISIKWHEDIMQGMAKTWYENGNLESEREMSNNKKNGLSFGYYKTGELMLSEEYEQDRLMKGSYYKKGETLPISTVEDGFGTATIFHPDGHFIHKITYEKGRPIIE